MGTSSIPLSGCACNRRLISQSYNCIVISIFRAMARALTSPGSCTLAFIIFPPLTPPHNVPFPLDWTGPWVVGMSLVIFAAAVLVSQLEPSPAQLPNIPLEISQVATFNRKKRAIIYTRVSSDEQAEIGTSLANQVEKSLAYAQAKGLDVVAIFKEDYTGTTLDRPELNKVRAMLRTGQAEVLIGYKTSRLDRSEWGVNLLILLQEIKSLNAELHYSQKALQVDLNNPVEALMQSIEGWQSGEDRSNIVRQLQEGRIKRVMEGGVMVSNKPPYGYRLAKKGNLCVLVIDEVEARIIRLIFYWYTEGENGQPLSLRQIVHRLNEMKIPTASHTDHRLVNRKREDICWRPGTVHQILKNETYIGTWHYNKKAKVNGKLVHRDKSEWIGGVDVPVIIDQATFAIAQFRLIENKQKAGRVAKSQYLMSKRMKCHCGYKICGIKDGRRGGKLYYGCPGRRSPKAMRHTCDLPYFPASKVDTLIWQWIRGFFEDEELLEQGIADYQARQAEVIKPLLAELTLVSQTINEYEKQLDENLRALKLLGDNPPLRSLANIRADIERVEAQLDGLEMQRRKIQAQMEAALVSKRDIHQVLERLRQIKAELGEALNLADVTFEDRRFLIERLNVEATLLVENGQKVVQARCYLGEKEFNCHLPDVRDKDK